MQEQSGRLLLFFFQIKLTCRQSNNKTRFLTKLTAVIDKKVGFVCRQTSFSFKAIPDLTSESRTNVTLVEDRGPHCRNSIEIKVPPPHPFAEPSLYAKL